MLSDPVELVKKPVGRKQNRERDDTSTCNEKRQSLFLSFQM